MVRPVGAAISRPPTFRDRALDPNHPGNVPSGRLIAAPTAFPVHPGLLWPSGCFPSSVTGFARATFPVGEGFLRRGTKPSPGRGWLGEAETGVGRYWVGLGTAPLPALRGHLPPREGWRAAVRTQTWCRPSSGPWGATFPQGKVRDHRQDMTGHLPLRSSKRFTGGYQFSSTVPVRPWRFFATLM